jgi:lipoate---protein ligase
VPEPLRVINFGSCSPLRSQTLWHAIAYGVGAGSPVTLSFTRPAAPYVSLGYHRGRDELDLDYCRVRHLPVFRRMVGGGPVYLDSSQLLFQICLPARAVPAARTQALRMLLGPVVSAFRAVGVAAVLDHDLEISVGEAKICGHGAAQIEDAVVVCGNLIERFDHKRAAGVLSLTDAAQRSQTLDLMRRFVIPTPVDPALFQDALVHAYGQVLELEARSGELCGTERRSLARLDERFMSDAWSAGPDRPRAIIEAQPRARQVKVRSGVWTLGATYGGSRVAAGVVRGNLELVRLYDRGLNGSTREAETALCGVPWSSVTEVLARFGDSGRRLTAAFATADPRRL